MSQQKYGGVWPVMLTPFDSRGEIDWPALSRLIDWYIESGVHGLFAACQSSEMFYLSDEETQALVKFVVRHVNGRVPVVASGHTATGLSQQKIQLQAIADTGVDGVIMISNRLALAGDSDAQALATLQELTAALPASVDLGIYECPYPYKRLLSDEIVKWCADSQRFTFIKDTCCSLPVIERRLALTEGSRLNIANANSQTLLASLRAGCTAYSGIMANFHPELYVWLYENWKTDGEKADKLANYLSTSALAETLDYPVCAKYHQRKINNFTSIYSRTRNSQNFDSSFFPEAIDSMIELGEEMKKTLSLSR